MSIRSIQQFVQDTGDTVQQTGAFEVESERVLQINLAGKVTIKMGSMIAYRGNITFERSGLFEQGLGTLLKKVVSGEGDMLTHASGQGQLYLGDQGKLVSVLQLQGDAIIVNGESLLAFQSTVQNTVTMMRRVSAIASGGLFNIRLQGQGLIAIATHGEPLTLPVRRGEPVFTDPQATVAWSANLQPEFKTDVQFKTLLGRGSGESFQMRFDGDGFVVVQPYEPSYTAGEA